MAGLNTSRLKTQLLNTGLQQKDNPLYQVIFSLIGALESLEGSSSGSGGGGGGGSSNIVNEIQNILGGPAFDGNDGLDGISIKGDTGATGATGALGIPGLDGLDGEDGIAVKGDKGDKGDAGQVMLAMDGQDGQDGISIKGDRGDIGPTGLHLTLPIVDTGDGEYILATPSSYDINDFARKSISNQFLQDQFLNGSRASVLLGVTNTLNTGTAELRVTNDAGEPLRILMLGSSFPDEGRIVTQGAFPLTLGTLLTEAFRIDPTQFIDSPTQPRCVAYAAGTQALTTATFTAIALDTEDLDVSGMHSNVTNNSRITIPTGGDGLYLVIGYLQYAGSAAGAVRQVDIRKNGATFLAQTLLTPNGVNNIANMATWLGVLVATDYVELIGFQDTGGNLNVGSASRFAASSLSVVKLW